MTLVPHAIENLKPLDEVSHEVEQLKIYYPRGCQTVAYRHDCQVNGASFLSQLIRFGWEYAVRGRTMHLTHPAADYSEA